MSKPKISVVIPMYNAEKFIRQCLISVLASKFTDYEVVVVDDCSTDNSVAEVEKLLPHFDRRLKIFSTQANSGGAGIPRNVGIKNSSGKYVTFIDNDDMILPTALGNFFEVAEKFQADVVHTESYLLFEDANQLNGKNLKPEYIRPLERLVKVPTPEPDDLKERIRLDMADRYFILPWGKFYRREFLLENKIDFPQMRMSEDLTFCFKCLCLAKNYIRAPFVTNMHRDRQESTARLVIDFLDGVRLWLNILFANMAILDDFMSELEFFQRNPAIHRDVLKFYIGKHFDMVKNFFRGMPTYEVQKSFFDELQNSALNPTGKNLVAAYFFAERVLTK